MPRGLLNDAAVPTPSARPGVCVRLPARVDTAPVAPEISMRRIALLLASAYRGAGERSRAREDSRGLAPTHTRGPEPRPRALVHGTHDERERPCRSDGDVFGTRESRSSPHAVRRARGPRGAAHESSHGAGGDGDAADSVVGRVGLHVGVLMVVGWSVCPAGDQGCRRPCCHSAAVNSQRGQTCLQRPSRCHEVH